MNSDPVDSEVWTHLNASHRNLTIATDLLEHRPDGLDSPPFEWVAVVCFYSSVRSVNALILGRSGELPRSHRERYRFIRQSNELIGLLHDYADLRDWSEQARYTAAHSSFGANHAQTALDSATMIYRHVADLLTAE